VRRPPSECDLTLRQADQARSDFAAIEDGLEFIMAQMLKVLTQKALARIAVGSFASGAAFAVLVMLLLVHLPRTPVLASVVNHGMVKNPDPNAYLAYSSAAERPLSSGNWSSKGGHDELCKVSAVFAKP
jgi:hypothetical protein